MQKGIKSKELARNQKPPTFLLIFEILAVLKRLFYFFISKKNSEKFEQVKGLNRSSFQAITNNGERNE